MNEKKEANPEEQESFDPYSEASEEEEAVVGVADETEEEEAGQIEEKPEEPENEEKSEQEAAAKQKNKASAKQRIDASSRFKKLKGEKEDVEGRYKVLEDENRLLKLNRQQTKNVLPKPEVKDYDFDDQNSDYQKQLKAYEDQEALRSEEAQNEKFDKRLDERLKKERVSIQQETLKRESENRVREHYTRAETANKDYLETENRAIEVIGEKATLDIIENFGEEAIALLYKIGKDTVLASEVADAVAKGDSVQAVRLLERASSKLKPKRKTHITPAPDEDLSGGSPSASMKKRGPSGGTYR